MAVIRAALYAQLSNAGVLSLALSTHRAIDAQKQSPNIDRFAHMTISRFASLATSNSLSLARVISVALNMPSVYI